MMNVDTRNGLMAVIAMSALALVIVGSLIGIIVLSVAHDGTLSNEAMDTFKQILLGTAGLGALLGIIESNAKARTAIAAISAGANVQGSPISVTTTALPAPIAAPVTTPIVSAVPEPTNDPAAGSSATASDLPEGPGI